MSRFGVFAAIVIAGLASVGTALAQGVPPRLQGDYAMGSCAAPNVDVTIDMTGLSVLDPESGETIADVTVLAVEDRGAEVVMDVVLDGNEDGTMTLVTLDGGAVEVRYQPDGGAEEAPQRLELCVAADVPAQPPVTMMSAMPDALRGEWVTGSCAAPQDRLVIEATVLTAYDQGSPEATAVVDVITVDEIPGGYLVAADFAGQQVGIEFIVVNQDILELVFIGPDGGRDTPQELVRCTPAVDAPPVDTPPVSLAVALPDAYLGRYAVGADAVCGGDATEVIFEPSRLTVTEGGEQLMTIDVVAVIATEPDLVFAVVARGDPGEVTMRQIGAASYEVVFTESGGSSEAPEVFNRCEAEAGPVVNPPVTAVIPDAYLGRYAFDGGTCDAVAGGDYLLFEATQLVVFDGGNQAMVIPVTGVIATDPDLVFTVTVPGEGPGEVAMRPGAGNRYDVTLTESGSDSGDRDEFIFCDSAIVTDGPVIDGPVIDGPMAAEVPAAYLGRYVFGSDPAACGAVDTGEGFVFEPTRLVMTDGGREIVIDVTGVIATAPELVLAVSSDRLGEAELALSPIGDGVYDVTFTEPDGSVENETLVYCDAVSDTAPVDGPELPPMATELPAAYLGRYVFDTDSGLGCDSTENEVIFEATRLVVYERGEVEMEIDVLAVIATEPDLVFAAILPGEGEVEVSMRAVGGNAYEVGLTESGSDRTETETFIYCSAGTEGPGPMPTGGGDLTAFLFDTSAAAFDAFMTDLEAACAPGSEQQCLDTFYGFADVTGDGLLTQAELARLTRFGAKWAVAANMPRLQEGHKLAIHLATMVTGPLIADGLIYNFDYDGNNALSQIELFPEGAENAPLAMEALMRTFTENTIEEVIDALEDLDDLM